MSNYTQQLSRYKAKQRTHVLSLLIGAIIIPIMLVMYLGHLSSKVTAKDVIRAHKTQVKRY